MFFILYKFSTCILTYILILFAFQMVPGGEYLEELLDAIVNVLAAIDWAEVVE